MFDKLHTLMLKDVTWWSLYALHRRLARLEVIAPWPVSNRAVGVKLADTSNKGPLFRFICTARLAVADLFDLGDVLP